MSMRDDILRERRLSEAEARRLVELAKARGWLSVRTDVLPVRFHGNMAYVPRAKRSKVAATLA